MLFRILKKQKKLKNCFTHVTQVLELEVKQNVQINFSNIWNLFQPRNQATLSRSIQTSQKDSNKLQEYF